MSKFYRGGFNINDYISNPKKDIDVEDLDKMLDEHNKKLDDIKRKKVILNKILRKQLIISKFNNSLNAMKELDTDSSSVIPDVIREDIDEKYTKCHTCNKFITKKNIRTHEKTKKHLKLSIINSVDEDGDNEEEEEADVSDSSDSACSNDEE